MNSHKLVTICSIFLSIFILGCASQNANKENSEQLTENNSVGKNETVEHVILNDSLRNALIESGNKIARLTALSLQRSLQSAIKEGGLIHAIKFCNIEAIPITDSVSETETVNIRRLAKKYRNPLNETNAMESELYKSYILEWLGGHELKPKIITDGNGHPVYYNPIYVGALCLNCHGEVGKNINEETAATIQNLYPEDKATNFKQGQLRGMWAITFTELKVK
jgi:hypothetical protein